MIPLTRRQIRALLALFIAVILYVTLWPFDFRFGHDFTAKRIARIPWVPFRGYLPWVLRDAVLNILLYLPIGALLSLARTGPEEERIPLLFPALMGGLFSVSIEVAQIWIPGRFPSSSDVCANAFGAFLGALSVSAWRRSVSLAGRDGVRRGVRRNALFIALVFYSITLIASNASTLDPVRNLQELAHRADLFLRSPLFGPFYPAKAFGAVLSLGVMAFLASEWVMVCFPRCRSPIAYIPVFLFTAGFAVALESLQILFRSRYPLRSDIFYGFLGAGYGIALHAATGLAALRRQTEDSEIESVIKLRLPSLFPLLVTHYALLVLYSFLYPFDFSRGHFHMDTRGLIPFYQHITRSGYSALYRVLRPFVAYLPAGVAYGYARRNTYRPNISWAAMVYAGGIQTMVEIGRAFTSYRYPDVTNILLAAAGAWAGTRIYHDLLERQ